MSSCIDVEILCGVCGGRSALEVLEDAAEVFEEVEVGVHLSDVHRLGFFQEFILDRREARCES